MRPMNERPVEELPLEDKGPVPSGNLDSLMRRIRTDEAARLRLVEGSPAVAGKLARLRLLLEEIRRRLVLSKAASRSVNK